MDTRDLFNAGWDHIGFAALLGAVFEDGRIFDTCIDSKGWARVNLTDPEGSVAWCTAVAAQRNMSRTSSRMTARAELVAYLRTINPWHVQILGEALRRGLTHRKAIPAAFPHENDYAALDRMIGRDIARQTVMAAAPLPTDRFYIGHMQELLPRALAEVGRAKVRDENCWQFLGRLHVAAGGKAQRGFSDSTSAPHIRNHDNQPATTYSLRIFRHLPDGDADRLIPQGAVLIFLNDGDRGHYALYAGGNRFVGSNFPTGTGVTLTSLADPRIGHQYDSVQWVVPDWGADLI